MLHALTGADVNVVTLREVPLSLEDAYMSISGVDSETPTDHEAPAEHAEE